MSYEGKWAVECEAERTLKKIDELAGRIARALENEQTSKMLLGSLAHEIFPEVAPRVDLGELSGDERYLFESVLDDFRELVMGR